MTVDQYIEEGFEISKQVTQEVIDRAESDILNAYYLPIMGDDTNAERDRAEIMALTFCLLLRRTVQKTRFGAEQKRNQFGSYPGADGRDSERHIASVASVAINSLRAKTTKTEVTSVIDIIDFNFYTL